MRMLLRRTPSPAFVIALVALMVGLSGSAVASVAGVPWNSVGTAQLKGDAVVSSRVKNRSLMAVDFKRGQLPRGARGLPGPAGPAGPVGPAGPAGPPGMSQLQQVLVNSATDSSSPKTASARCPSGKKAVGGGALPVNFSVPGAPIAIRASFPDADGAGWTATAFETGGFRGSWAIRVYATCAVVS